MRVILLLIILNFIWSFSYGQNSSLSEPAFIARIIDIEENYIISGALLSINDTGLVLTCSDCKPEEIQSFLIPVSYQRIGILKIQSKDMLKLSGIFYCSSLLFGALPASYLSHNFLHSSTNENFRQQMENSADLNNILIRMSLIGAIPGSLLGLLCRNIFKEKLQLKKDKKMFADNYELIKKYCLIQ